VPSDDGFEAERGQVLRTALTALDAEPASSPEPKPQAKTRQPALESWPELSRYGFLRFATLTQPAPLHRIEPVKAAPQPSWLDGQLPLIPLTVPLWKVAEDFSTLIPDSWRPVLISRYVLWGSLLILVLYPAWRLVAQEIAYRREERELSSYD
jgi:hypothetical protein